MSCKEETRAIGEHNVYCRQWSAEKAIVTKFKIAKIFGASFASLATALTSKNAESEVGNAISTLFDKNDPKQIYKFIRTIVESATIDSERITDKNFDELFRDDLGLFYKIFGFVLEVNYSDFFGGKLGKSIKAKMDLIQKNSEDGLKDTAQT